MVTRKDQLRVRREIKSTNKRGHGPALDAGATDREEDKAEVSTKRKRGKGKLRKMKRSAENIDPAAAEDDREKEDEEDPTEPAVEAKPKARAKAKPSGKAPKAKAKAKAKAAAKSKAKAKAKAKGAAKAKAKSSAKRAVPEVDEEDPSLPAPKAKAKRGSAKAKAKAREVSAQELSCVSLKDALWYLEVTTPEQLAEKLVDHVNLFPELPLAASSKCKLKAELMDLKFCQLTVYWTRATVGVFAKQDKREIANFSPPSAFKDVPWSKKQALALKTGELLGLFVDFIIADDYIKSSDLAESPEVAMMTLVLRGQMQAALAMLADS